MSARVAWNRVFQASEARRKLLDQAIERLDDPNNRTPVEVLVSEAMTVAAELTALRELQSAVFSYTEGKERTQAAREAARKS